jgi:ABC-type Fe3+-hydroxamate transport system substrate-binding protein
MAAPRVVSLVPSATESLLAMGVRPVAVTRFCPTVPGAAPVGGTKDPHLAEIVALRPDVVVMCVEENREEDADALAAEGLAIAALDIDTVDDVGPQLAELAARLGVAAPSLDVPPPLPPDGRTAFVPVWRRPWMTVSGRTYASSALERLGVRTAFADHEERYPTVTLEDVRARGPALVVAPDEPYPFGERHRAELETIAPAVLVDGRDLLWWGTRTPAALARLAGVLHPPTGP